jgi:hypothetical protein
MLAAMGTLKSHTVNTILSVCAVIKHYAMKMYVEAEV